jgi:hypothetical protein
VVEGAGGEVNVAWASTDAGGEQLHIGEAALRREVKMLHGPGGEDAAWARRH